MCELPKLQGADVRNDTNTLTFADMVPPFLAYYGATSGDFSAVLEAYNQCKLYRTALQDPTTSLWKHIILGSWNDVGLWATGERLTFSARVHTRLTPSIVYR